METRQVKFREWSLWAIAVLALFGVGNSDIRTWLRLALPAFSWVVATIDVPWAVIAIPFTALIFLAYTVGSRRAKRRIRLAAQAGSDAFKPTDLDIEIIRFLRWFDGWSGAQNVTKNLTGEAEGASESEVILALKGLAEQGWLSADPNRPTDTFPVRSYLAYRLDKKGMDFAKLRSFPHRRKAT